MLIFWSAVRMANRKPIMRFTAYTRGPCSIFASESLESQELAEDVLQEAFVSAFQNLKEFPGEIIFWCVVEKNSGQ
jgi:DNA-directed RNA polymerase specialized sigma24 family protein